MKKVYHKIIDFIFYNESKIKNAVAEYRIDTHHYRELKNGSGISDPTARDAIKHLDPINQITVCGRLVKFPEKWLAVIEKTYNWCKRQSDTHFQAVYHFYNDKKGSGYYYTVSRQLSTSVKTFYNLVDRAKMYAALQAVQYRLIHLD